MSTAEPVVRKNPVIAQAPMPRDLHEEQLRDIARFVVANHRRALNSEKSFVARFKPLDFAPSPEDIAIADLSLSKAWSKLNPFERQAISLTAFEGLSNQDAAKVLEISPNAITQRLAKARANLRANLS